MDLRDAEAVGDGERSQEGHADRQPLALQHILNARARAVHHTYTRAHIDTQARAQTHTCTKPLPAPRHTHTTRARARAHTHTHTHTRHGLAGTP